MWELAKEGSSHGNAGRGVRFGEQEENPDKAVDDREVGEARDRLLDTKAVPAI